jgi:Arc/MetJ-type ribon-helix-helix transcriptional regulator
VARAACFSVSPGSGLANLLTGSAPAVVMERIAMSDKKEPGAAPPEMIEVTVRVPARVLADYNADVDRGIYADRDESLRVALVDSWRFRQRRFSTLRIDLRDPADKRPDTDKPEAGELLAAADSLRDPETGEPEAGEGDEREP